jgi:hypothetical protein
VKAVLKILVLAKYRQGSRKHLIGNIGENINKISANIKNIFFQNFKHSRYFADILEISRYFKHKKILRYFLGDISFCQKYRNIFESPILSTVGERAFYTTGSKDRAFARDTGKQ